MRRFVFVLSLLFLSLPALHAQIVAGSSLGSAITIGNNVGNPCTVEYLTTYTQTLLDGTHINRTEKRIFYRDSQGRVRVETYSPGGSGTSVGEAMHVTIHDPVDKRTITLMPRSHTALVRDFPHTPARDNASAGMSSSQTAPSATSTSATTLHGSIGSGVQMQGIHFPGSQQIATEKLDAQTFNGVDAEGRRTTLTRPVGAIGNDRPLVTITDLYTSPELGIEVYTKSDDPQSGERVTEIQRLDRGEPDPGLFQIPEGYTTRDYGASPSLSATATH